MRNEWNPDLASPPPSLGPPSMCPRVYLVCITRFEISAAYYTGFIFSSSSGKYFTGIPKKTKQGKVLMFLCVFDSPSKLITTYPIVPGRDIKLFRYSATSPLSAAYNKVKISAILQSLNSVKPAVTYHFYLNLNLS